jgi:hypothetical protein
MDGWMARLTLTLLTARIAFGVPGPLSRSLQALVWCLPTTSPLKNQASSRFSKKQHALLEREADELLPSRAGSRRQPLCTRLPATFSAPRMWLIRPTAFPLLDGSMGLYSTLDWPGCGWSGLGAEAKRALAPVAGREGICWILGSHLPYLASLIISNKCKPLLFRTYRLVHAVCMQPSVVTSLH